jgi:hypothetical protein
MAEHEARGGGERMRLRRWQAGQHVAEYALLIGLATAAVIGVQYYARSGMNGAIRGTSDLMFGPPPANDPAEEVKAADTVQRRLVTEVGTDTSAVATSTGERVTGQSLNEAARLTITPYPAAPTYPGPGSDPDVPRTPDLDLQI